MEIVKLENVAAKQSDPNPVLMRCGCVAHAHRLVGALQEPYCLVHDETERSQQTPDLKSRIARCTYFGPIRFRDYGPIYGGGRCSREKCSCIVPSSLALPFFEFKGVRSTTALEICSCGVRANFHWQRWRATFKVMRRWFRIDRYESIQTEEKHLRQDNWAETWAQYERTRWLKVGDGPSLTGDRSEPTKVLSVELLSLSKILTPSRIKVCSNFKAAGPAEFDSFFCGCAGWD